MLLLAVSQSMKHEARQETPYTKYGGKLCFLQKIPQSQLRNLQQGVPQISGI